MTDSDYVVCFDCGGSHAQSVIDRAKWPCKVNHNTRNVHCDTCDAAREIYIRSVEKSDRILKLEHDLQVLRDWCDVREKRITKYSKHIHELKAALRKHGIHMMSCPWQRASTCNCGLAAVRDAEVET